MDHTRHDQMRQVRDVCSDEAEIFALSVARFLAAGYSTGDVACWDTAYAGAEHVLGAGPGGRLVASLIGLIRAIRVERKGGWSFMPATCCRVTADEAAILRLLAQARGGDPNGLGKIAADFAQAAAAPRTEDAARTAAAVLDEIALRLSDRTAPYSGTAAQFH